MNDDEDNIGDVIRSMGRNPTDEEIEEIKKEVKTDDEYEFTMMFRTTSMFCFSGNIEISDFVDAVSSRLGGSEGSEQERLREAFRVFDRDGNGELSVEEVREIMTNKASSQPSYQPQAKY